MLDSTIILRVKTLPATEKKGTRISVLNMCNGRHRTLTYDYEFNIRDTVVSFLSEYDIHASSESFGKHEVYLIYPVECKDGLKKFFNRENP